jgi:hypothetical protein
LLFKLPPDTAGSTKSVNCYFDTTLGNNIAPLSSIGYWNGAMSISLIANGTEFQALTNSHDWGFGD